MAGSAKRIRRIAAVLFAGAATIVMPSQAWSAGAAYAVDTAAVGKRADQSEWRLAMGPHRRSPLPALRRRLRSENVRQCLDAHRRGVRLGRHGRRIELSLIHISEPTRQAEI